MPLSLALYDFCLGLLRCPLSSAIIDIGIGLLNICVSMDLVPGVPVVCIFLCIISLFRFYWLGILHLFFPFLLWCCLWLLVLLWLRFYLWFLCCGLGFYLVSQYTWQIQILVGRRSIGRCYRSYYWTFERVFVCGSYSDFFSNPSRSFV